MRYAILLAALSATALNADAAYQINTSGFEIPGGTVFYIDRPEWRCVKTNGSACTAADIANPAYRHIVIPSTGFNGSAGKQAFYDDLSFAISLMTDPASAGTSWTAQKRDKILWFGFYTAGGDLGTDQATFKAAISPHPIRGYATNLDQNAVYQWMEQQRATIPNLKPLAVAVFYNSFQEEVTANAAPPSVVGKPYGVCKFTRIDLTERGAYVPTHELAHAGLNFLDEYVEAGFQDSNIRLLDYLTPLVLLDASWRGLSDAIANVMQVYSYQISEILSHNGSDNMTVSRFPATVIGEGYVGQDYQYEGGMFFGRGTFHMRGNNLMNGERVMRGADDSFDFAHSPAQQLVIKQAFGEGPQRPNDRLRSAGPNTDWHMSFGSTTRLMTFDADKLHHFQPTRRYDVQIGWYEREWKTCWWGPFPYPCHTDVWRVAERSVVPDNRGITLSLTAGFGLAWLMQRVVCAFGINEIEASGGSFKLCEQSLEEISQSYVPTVTFRLPYQDIDAPAAQMFTTYHWRFRTRNDRYTSQWTGWSTFRRVL